MKKEQWKTKYIKLFILCLLFRLIPYRTPNVEPILCMQMPLSKKHGLLGGFIFGFGSIFIYDLLTKTIGIWTIVTAFTYGLVGIGATYFFKKYSISRINFVLYAIIGTLFYDSITGLFIGPLFFHQNFLNALIGQIPFTILHLLGNCTFAFFISPALYKFLTENKQRKRSKKYFQFKNLCNN